MSLGILLLQRKRINVGLMCIGSCWCILQTMISENTCSPQVEKCYEISGAFCKTEGKDAEEKLQELSSLLNALDAGETIVVCSSFSHMLNLGNLAEEVQIATRRPANKKGNIGDENSALTESDMEQTFERLVKQLGKTPEEIFEALKDQTVDLVFTAHPTQSVRRSLLQKHSR